MLTQIQVICALSKLGYACTYFDEDMATFEKDGTSIDIDESTISISQPVSMPGFVQASGKKNIMIATYPLSECFFHEGIFTLPKSEYFKIQNS